MSPWASGLSFLNPKPLSYCLPSLFSSCFVFEVLCSFLSFLCFLYSLLFERLLSLDTFLSTLSAYFLLLLPGDSCIFCSAL